MAHTSVRNGTDIEVTMIDSPIKRLTEHECNELAQFLSDLATTYQRKHESYAAGYEAYDQFGYDARRFCMLLGIPYNPDPNEPGEGGSHFRTSEYEERYGSEGYDPREDYGDDDGDPYRGRDFDDERDGPFEELYENEQFETGGVFAGDYDRDEGPFD